MNIFSTLMTALDWYKDLPRIRKTELFSIRSSPVFRLGRTRLMAALSWVATSIFSGFAKQNCSPDSKILFTSFHIRQNKIDGSLGLVKGSSPDSQNSQGCFPSFQIRRTNPLSRFQICRTEQVTFRELG